MGGLNVKNTIVERVLQIVAPHPCSGCGKVGTILCDDCKNDIIHEPFMGCLLCGAPQRGGICDDHHSPITRAFITGQRIDALETCINRLKFHNLKAATGLLAELLDESLPQLPENLIIVPIPTVRSHVRQRGYDQVELLAKHLSKRRKLSIVHTLSRRTTTTQHTVGRNQRKTQASHAFTLRETTHLAGRTVLLLDDVVTTGSTLEAAATLLKNAGAIVWVAALAYQPLD